MAREQPVKPGERPDAYECRCGWKGPYVEALVHIRLNPDHVARRLRVV